MEDREFVEIQDRLLAAKKDHPGEAWPEKMILNLEDVAAHTEPLEADR